MFSNSFPSLASQKISLASKAPNFQPDEFNSVIYHLDFEQLTRETHFSRQEIRAIYRTFKEASTNVIIHRDIVRQIFAQLFPHGDTEHFADLIFNAFDADQSGAITFDKFLRGFSTLTRGTLEEKLDWVYRLYDPLRSGQISWHRLFYVLTATEDLLDTRRRGRMNPKERDERREKHAQALFRKFDHDGRVSRENFLAVCRRDPAILESFDNLEFRLF